MSQGSGELAAAAVDLNIKIPDFLAQSIAVEAKHICCTNLVTAIGCQGCRQKRDFNLLENAMIEARWRHAIGKSCEMRREIHLHCPPEVLYALGHIAAC